VSSAQSKALIFAGIAVVVIAIVAYNVSRKLQPRVRTVPDVTLVKLDIEKRTAEVRFVHPKSSRPILLSGRVPEDCAITINDEPATLADLRVGDVATVRGMIYPDQSVEAEWVKVTRPTDTQPSTTAPAATPPDAPPDE
jgi:hypothetical protein